MNMIFSILLYIALLTEIQGAFRIQRILSGGDERIPKDFSTAVMDIAMGLPTKSLAVVRGNTTDIRSEDLFKIMCLLNENNIQIVNLDLKTVENKEKYFSYLMKGLDTSEERTSLILCEPVECEDLLYEITIKNYIHRSILYMFYWPRGDVSKLFLSGIKEAIRVLVITNPRQGVFRLYYNQATPNKLNHLSLVNWWSGRLYKSPTLPPADKVYQDFRGRTFDVPVLDAPPWHFVIYNNDSTINVTGGRDDKLLSLLAKKLNFKYEYYDPPERSQGSSIAGNGTFKGTLGLIWKRKADFFLGDVTMTWERLQAVEFSFLTLADSGAFLTHSPDKLSETLAIIRPFRWEVWPLVGATLLMTGPALWIVIAAPRLWQGRKQGLLSLLYDCCWFTTSLFLRQSSIKEPSRTHKARLVSILISLGATYVIGDMYSANLTSLLARPAREPSIGTLQALEEAMEEKGYELVVESHSSSLAILENGTGVYGRLARLMRRQRIQQVRSVEVGVSLVLSKRRVAILGGRETLYYDTEKFGSHNFHLSEKLYTRYSAIALQIGCPYLETFNKVVMTLFEAGILGKMTTDEYKNLPEHSRRSGRVTESESKESVDVKENTQATQVNSFYLLLNFSSVVGLMAFSRPDGTQSESTIGLEPVSLRMFRGAFFLLSIGYSLAAAALIGEIQIHSKRQNQKATKPIENTITARKSPRIRVKRIFGRITRNMYMFIDRALGHDVRE